MKLRSIAFGIIAAFGLAACVSPKYVTSDVTRFHTLPASPSGQTFAITALNRDQEQSLEYRQYADLVNAKLTALGLKQFTGGTGKADYVVTLNYDVDGPSPDVRSRASNVSVGFGYGTGYWGRRNAWAFGGAYEPWPDNYTNTEQIYLRRVELTMYKGSTYATDKAERVFEGRALSEGLNGQLSPVMPYILDAIFQDFPGASGSTRTVRVQVPQDLKGTQGAPATNPRLSY
ncbi:MAG: DUF4136 domain-containing protein [Rhodospirillaceae bacterium]|nr:DUF4136 domain-containing protein [Rhodospirillaceae bacterium]